MGKGLGLGWAGLGLAVLGLGIWTQACQYMILYISQNHDSFGKNEKKLSRYLYTFAHLTVLELRRL